MREVKVTMTVILHDEDKDASDVVTNINDALQHSDNCAGSFVVAECDAVETEGVL